MHMNRIPSLSGVLCFLLWGCSSETLVVLNERILDVDGEVVGASCGTFGMGDGSATVSTATSAAKPGAIVVQLYGNGGPVRVRVTQAGKMLTERFYDESFFEERRAETFTVKDTGGHQWELRYWGAPKKSGEDGCTPFDRISAPGAQPE